MPLCLSGGCQGPGEKIVGGLPPVSQMSRQFDVESYRFHLQHSDTDNADASYNKAEALRVQGRYSEAAYEYRTTLWHYEHALHNIEYSLKHTLTDAPTDEAWAAYRTLGKRRDHCVVQISKTKYYKRIAEQAAEREVRRLGQSP